MIEVMGLAVLPARLAVELDVLREKMLARADLTEDPRTAPHAEWAVQVLHAHPEFAPEHAEQILRLEVGKAFEQVLCDAGVFKRTPQGQEAFLDFVEGL